MTKLATQLLVMSLGGLAVFVLVLHLAKRGLLSLRYALGWLAVSALLLISTMILAVTGGVSERLPFTPTGALAAGGFMFVLLIALQLSISLSGQQEAIRELTEANALLEERLSQLERRGVVP